MGRRWLVNLLLLLVLGLLGLGIRHELVREGRPQTLAGMDPGDLRLIEVEREGEPRIRLERGPDGWRLLEPLRVDADAARVERLAAILQAPVQRSFPAQSANLPELGLAPAKLRLRLDGLALAIGGLDPLTQRRYVEADGLVHLIEDRYYHLLIAPPIDLVSHALMPAGSPPAFATLRGVPVAPSALGTLAGLTAERVEALAGDLSGEPLQVKFGDGRALRFLVSEDRRRWSRLDQRLRYVLTDGPLLELDPGAVDPTPPEPVPGASLGLEYGALVEGVETWPAPGAAGLQGRFDPPRDPDAPAPELPEVETTLRGILPHLHGRRVEALRVREPRLRLPIPPDLPTRVASRSILGLSRRAKYLLIELEGGTLILHLGMSGSLRVLPADTPAAKHDHVDLVLSGGFCLRLRDPRRFGLLVWTWARSRLARPSMAPISTGRAGAAAWPSSPSSWTAPS